MLHRTVKDCYKFEYYFRPETSIFIQVNAHVTWDEYNKLKSGNSIKNKYITDVKPSVEFWWIQWKKQIWEGSSFNKRERKSFPKCGSVEKTAGGTYTTHGTDHTTVGFAFTK